MLRKIVILGLVLGLIGLAAFYVLTMPGMLSAAELPNHKPDPANGKYLFIAGG